MDDLLKLIRERWSTLHQADQRAIRAGGIVVAIVLLVGLVIMPAYRSFEGLQQRVPVMKGQLLTMKAQALEAKKLSAHPVSERNNESLMVVLEKSTMAHGIKPSVQSLTPRTERSAAIRFKSVEYPKLIKWLAGLNSQYHLNASEAELTKTTTPGTVDAHFVFSD